MSFKDFCKHVETMYTEGNAWRDRIDELEEAMRVTEVEHERLKAQHSTATRWLEEIVMEQNRLMGRNDPTEELSPNSTIERDSSFNAGQPEDASNRNTITTNGANASASPTGTQTSLRPLLPSAQEGPMSSATDLTNEDSGSLRQGVDAARTFTKSATTSNGPRRSAGEAGTKMRENMQRDFPYTNMGRDKHKTPKKKAEG